MDITLGTLEEEYSRKRSIQLIFTHNDETLFNIPYIFELDSFYINKLVFKELAKDEKVKTVTIDLSNFDRNAVLVYLGANFGKKLHFGIRGSGEDELLKILPIHQLFQFEGVWNRIIHDYAIDVIPHSTIISEDQNPTANDIKTLYHTNGNVSN